MRVAAFATLVALVLAATAGADPRPSEYVIPGPAVFPEGVAFQPSTGAYFVSSTSDGTIFRGHVSELEASVFLAGGDDGRTGSYGLEVDGSRLYVAGGPTNRAFVYDTETRRLLASYTIAGTGFLNDIATTKSGDAFMTDSMVSRPILWRIPADLGPIEPWLSFVGTACAYEAGFNANGIVASEDGKYLIVSLTGPRKLCRIDLATKEVVQIATNEPVGGDGLVLQGRTLYAIERGGIAEVQLSGDFTSGTVVSRTENDARFSSPTTNAIARGRMLVVNSQFARRASMTQVLPFTVSSVEIP